MPYQFFDSLFSADPEVRIAINASQAIRIDETRDVDGKKKPLSNLSYVDITLPSSAFAIRHDENFHAKRIFSNVKGYQSKNDYFIVAKTNLGIELFIVELKSRCYRKSKVKNQLLSGVAMVSYCIRLGIDRTKDVAGFGMVKIYAIVLTNTISDFSGTGIRANKDIAKYIKACGTASGVMCVNGHTATLEDLRTHAIPVTFDGLKSNDLDVIPPYPGTGDI